MLWPTPVDYALAVGGFPDISLLDSKLKGGKPKRNHTNLLVYSGGFSTVFPIEMDVDTYALRCWTRDIGGAKSRYEKISGYLKQVCLPYFVDFEYVPEGILINGKKYPITRMEWADGELLRDFIARNLQNATIFKTVADEFQKMVATLHIHKISHGDLQNGNILIKKMGTDVEIKLIDYDSLFVPALRGQLSPTPGLPEYQHSARGSLSDEKVDYFSELVIYLSFLTLAEKPGIWDQFDLENRSGDGLLFSKKDFQNPDQSDIFQELEKLSPDVQQLAATLKDFCAKTSIDQLAPLEAILPKPNANTCSNRGEVLLNDERYNEALAEFRKAIALDPNYEKARYGIGRVFLHSKQYVDAINTFEQLIKDEPNYKEAHHALGLAYFKSGDNSKATAAANAALRIDPRYQPARELLYTIKSTTPPSVTPPLHKSKPRPDPKPDPVPALWQHITGVLKRNWCSVTIGTLGLALIICFVGFLIQMSDKDAALSRNAVLAKQLDQKVSAIQGLTTSIENLESRKGYLNRENGKLQNELSNLIFAANSTSRDVVNLQKQLSKKEEALTSWVNENRELRSQLAEKDTELRTQVLIVRQLQKEKKDIQNENRSLQGKSRDIVRKNQELHSQNTMLQSQLNEVKQQDPDSVTKLPRYRDDKLHYPALPIKVSISKHINPRAPISKRNERGMSNNKGVDAFDSDLYSKAITHFSEAIKIDSEFAIAHYNLGCTYLKMKEYHRAIVYLNRAVALDQRFKEAHYNLGMAWFRLKVFRAAEKAVKKSLSFDSNYQIAQGLLTAIKNAQQ